MLLRAILDDDSVQVRPFEGHTVSESDTVPAKPFIELTVIVAVEPAVTEEGLAEILKSPGYETWTFTEWDNVPEDPVTVTI